MRKRRGAAKHGNQERWLLTYADLITLLLVFFVVLYSISKADVRQFARLSGSLQRAFNMPVLEGYDPTAASGKFGSLSGTSMIDDFVTIRGELARHMPAQQLPTGLSVHLNREGIIIRLANNILFPSGRADLNQDSLAVLNVVAAILGRIPNEVRVEGHTDNIPINTTLFPSNWELSTARAVAVTNYLVDPGKIAPERIGAVGYGEFRPIADNRSRETRASNRRTDILIVYPDAGRLLSSSEPLDLPASGE